LIPLGLDSFQIDPMSGDSFSLAVDVLGGAVSPDVHIVDPAHIKGVKETN
jgi:hypothetical protein